MENASLNPLIFASKLISTGPWEPVARNGNFAEPDAASDTKLLPDFNPRFSLENQASVSKS